ncbi:MAG: amidohydrolase family protein, partial [Acidimicrobiales bacterium]
MKSASTIISNGTIHSMDPDEPSPSWVEVRGGLVHAVGQNDPPPGEPLDLDGRTLLPGFHDAHVHPSLGGLALIRCDLHHHSTIEAFVETVGTYANEHPDVSWILGGGWSMEDVPQGIARAEWLDAVVPDRPVYLGSSEGHAAWANSLALKLAGIDSNTPDPHDGRIERDPDGTPNGTLQEGAAYLVERVLPATKQSETEAGIEAAQAMLLSV